MHSINTHSKRPYLSSGLAGDAAEDDALEQRVARQPIRTVHTTSDLRGRRLPIAKASYNALIFEVDIYHITTPRTHLSRRDESLEGLAHELVEDLGLEINT